MKGIAPTTELKKQFNHNSEKYAELKKYFFNKFNANNGAVSTSKKR